MPRSIAFLLVTALLATPSDAVLAQTDSPRSTVDSLFEGMRSGDAGMVRSVFAPVVRFALLTGDPAAPDVSAQSLESFVGAVAASGGLWDERIYDVEVRIDGRMASVWAPYTFYLDGELSHCGVNSIELLQGAEGWRITQISDTRRAEACPDPLEEG